MKRVAVCLVLLAGAAGLPACATPPADSAPAQENPVTVFHGFTLIDGRGGPPVANATLAVRDGRIVWVGPGAGYRVPSGAEVQDLTGKFVMPGIVNLHGHVGNVVGLTQDPKHFTRENVERQLGLYAAYGVTSVLSMGTEQPLILDIRAEQRASRPAVARVFTALRGFTNDNGYPTNAPGMKGVPFEVSSREEIENAVAELASHEVDVVKVWVDDHMGQETKIPMALATAVVEEAREAGLKPVAHVFYLEDAKALVEAGLAGLVHAVRDKPVDRELIEAMSARGAWQAASTLAREYSTYAYAEPPAFLDDRFFARAIPSDLVTELKSEAYRKRVASDPLFKRYPEFLRTAQQNLKRLADAGIRYGLGTDTGPPARFQGAFEHLELELMVEAGLTPAQAIIAATSSGAEFLGVAEDLGTLEEGKWADLIVLGTNPLEEIRNTRSIEAVYIAGNRVHRGDEPAPVVRR